MTRPPEAGRPLPLALGSRVAVIAGEGRLPADVAAQLESQGFSPFVLMCGRREQTAPELQAFEHRRMEVEEAPGLVPFLKSHGITHVVMAGAVVRRPRWIALRPRRYLPALALTAWRALRRGDDGLLRVVVETIEGAGIRVVGVHELVPDLVAPAGPLTKALAGSGDGRDLSAALAAARTLGALDIGQAAVSVGGRVIAVEGIEGTDGLLMRVRDLRGHGRIAHAKRGVLVKCAKPGQELRADLPTIGPDTVLLASAAGLGGIGVEAERSLVLDRKRTVEEADRLGLFIVGLE